MSPLEFKTREEWLAWRRSGIGASDTPIILNLSKYKKPFQLFQEKTGRVEPVETTNPAIEKGNELEPVARLKFAARWNMLYETGETFMPKNCVHPELPYMRASLDGCSNDGKTIIEIKYQGAMAHSHVMGGQMNKAHYAQMQHQFFVSGAERGWLVSIGADLSVHRLEVQRNEEYIKRIVTECVFFWECVKLNKWPTEAPWALVPQGIGAPVQLAPAVVPVERAGSLTDWLSAWDQITQEIKDLEAQKKEIQERIFSSGVEVCGEYRIKEVVRKGNIQYGNIGVLQAIDLEKYRGPEIRFKQITRAK